MEEWYHRAIKELEEKYQNAKPHDMKDFDGLVEAKGYCDICNQKKIVFFDRVSKKSFCNDCVDLGTQYYPFEMNEMWDVAHQLLYYFKKLVDEIDEPNHWVIPDDMWKTERGKRILADAKKIEDSVTEHCAKCGKEIR